MNIIKLIPWPYFVMFVGFCGLLWAICGSIIKPWTELPRDRQIRAVVALGSNAIVVLGYLAFWGTEPPPGWSHNTWIIVVSIIAWGLIVAFNFVVWQKALKPPKRIRFLVKLEEKEVKVLVKIKEDFEREYNKRQGGDSQSHSSRGVKLRKEEVQVELVTTEEQKDALSILENERIDVVAFDVTFRGELVRKGLVGEIHKGELQSPQTIHELSVALRTGGKKYFMPFRPNVKVVFLNKGAFAESNKKKYADLNANSSNLPKTWEDFFELAKKAHDNKGHPRVGLMAVEIDSALLLLELIRSAGGKPEVLSDKGTKEALHFLRKLWPYMDELCTELTFDTVTKHLEEKRLHLARNWAYAIRILEDAGTINQYIIYPGFVWDEGRPPAYLLGGDLLAIGRRTRHRKIALELIDYLLSKEVQAKLLRELSWPPARIDVRFAAPGASDTNKILHEAMRAAKPTPTFWSFEMSTILLDLFRTVTETDVDIDTGLGDLQRRITAEIRRQEEK